MKEKHHKRNKRIKDEIEKSIEKSEETMMKIMRNITKKGILAAFACVLMLTLSMSVCAAGNEDNVSETVQLTEIDNTNNNNNDNNNDNSNPTGDKAMAAALVVAAAAAAGAIGMGMAISKSVDGISRQPEADGKIRTTLMLGLVFVETAIIYALIVAILIIFVM